MNNKQHRCIRKHSLCISMCKCCSAKTLIILATCTQCVLSIIVWRSSQIQEGCRLQIEIHHVSRRLDIPTCVFIKILDAFCDLYVPNKNDKQLIQFKQVSLYIQKEIWAWTSCACFVELHSTKKKHTSKFPCLTAASCLKMIKVQGARSRRRILLILHSGSANDLRIATSDGSNWQ